MPDLARLYDDLAETYAAGRHRFDTTPILREFASPLPPGVRILDAGCGAGEPVARYFIERASRDSAGIGLATVYRALKAFMASGEIAQVEIPGLPPCYEPTDRGHHHHFICQHCRRVFDLPGCTHDLEALAPRDFQVRQRRPAPQSGVEYRYTYIRLAQGFSY